MTKEEEKKEEVLPEDEFFKKQEEHRSENNRILNIISLILGAGARALKMDKTGMWFGSVKFADAPLKMDLDGNIWVSRLAMKAIAAPETPPANTAYMYIDSTSGNLCIKFSTGAVKTITTP